MYRCYHCKDLHFAADQARQCFECGDAWVPAAVEKALKQAAHGPVPWWYKMWVRKKQPWTVTERMLWRALRRALPRGALRSQWWLPGSDYRGDFYIPAAGLVIEVDGSSHDGQEGEDRLRSMDLRHLGYEIARVTSEDVVHDAERIVTQIISRLQAAPQAPGLDVGVDDVRAA